MITEKDIPKIRELAAKVVAEVSKKKRRRQDWPLYARACLSIVRMCDSTPPPLRSIEQRMIEAMASRKRSA